MQLVEWAAKRKREASEGSESSLQAGDPVRKVRKVSSLRLPSRAPSHDRTLPVAIPVVATVNVPGRIFEAEPSEDEWNGDIADF